MRKIRLSWTSVAIALLLIVGGIGLTIWQLKQTPVTSASAADISAAENNAFLDPGTALGGVRAPGFTLRDQFGRLISLRQFRGKAVLLAFIDSQCTTICPLTSVELRDAQRLLGSQAAGLQLLAVDANPVATSVADVQSFSILHGMTRHWLFLTGSLSQLKAVWKQYGIYAAVVAGAIDHTPAVYLIDQRGREQEIFQNQMAYTSVQQQAHLFAAAAGRLLSGTAPSSVSYQQIDGYNPRKLVAFETLSGNHVEIGPGYPHLLVFFASWLRGSLPLAADLQNLNLYQTAAMRHGWPSLVAVDEATTEPTPNALTNFLGPLPIIYSVVRDTTGQLAAGYGVQDQPWLVLTAPSGKIIWHHDGLLSAAQLGRIAAKLVHSAAYR